MTIREHVLTVEAFWQKYAHRPFELIEGEVVRVAPTGNLHGLVGSRFIAQLRYHVDAHDLGEVYSSETGFYLSPTTIRTADAAFVRKSKLSLITDAEKYIPFAPDLAVEIVSPRDKAKAIQKKINLYLAAGTLLVWVAFPELRQVAVHHPDGTSEILSADDILDGGEVLPGFSVQVSKLFPPETTAESQELQEGTRS